MLFISKESNGGAITIMKETSSKPSQKSQADHGSEITSIPPWSEITSRPQGKIHQLVRNHKYSLRQKSQVNP